MPENIEVFTTEFLEKVCYTILKWTWEISKMQENKERLEMEEDAMSYGDMEAKNRELVRQLREREEELQYAYNAVMDIREEEARRIALELHDGIGQNLTSMLLYLRLCRREPTGERLTEILEKLQLLVSQTLSETQRIVRHMRPKALEELGLVQALYWYMNEYQKNIPQIELEYSIIVPGLNLPEDVEVALYRTILEAMTNIARHASANRVCFIMLRVEERLVIQISDDGVGMNIASCKRKGMGLLGMQERMRKIGAEYEMESIEGYGTWIRIVLADREK